MTDHNGKPVNDGILQDRLSLLVFGYSYCPEGQWGGCGGNPFTLAERSCQMNGGFGCKVFAIRNEIIMDASDLKSPDESTKLAGRGTPAIARVVAAQSMEATSRPSTRPGRTCSGAFTLPGQDRPFGQRIKSGTWSPLS